MGLILLIGVVANKEVIKGTILNFKSLHWEIKYALQGKSKAFETVWNLSQSQGKPSNIAICASATKV